VLEALAEQNRAYAEKFGYVFLIWRHRQEQREILNALGNAFRNDPDTELRIAVEEQRRSTRLRLEKLLELWSHVTHTPYLDVSLGRPAANVPYSGQPNRLADELGRITRGATTPMASAEWAAAKTVPAGTYRSTLRYSAYFTRTQDCEFISTIVIVFEVHDAQEHYQFPCCESVGIPRIRELTDGHPAWRK